MNPVPQLDIGLQVMYQHNNTAFKGPAALAQNASRPAVINGVIDDQNVWSAMFRWQRNFYHDRLSDPGKLQAPGGQPPGVLFAESSLMIGLISGWFRSTSSALSPSVRRPCPPQGDPNQC